MTGGLSCPHRMMPCSAHSASAFALQAMPRSLLASTVSDSFLVLSEVEHIALRLRARILVRVWMRLVLLSALGLILLAKGLLVRGADYHCLVCAGRIRERGLDPVLPLAF